MNRVTRRLATSLTAIAAVFGVATVDAAPPTQGQAAGGTAGTLTSIIEQLGGTAEFLGGPAALRMPFATSICDVVMGPGSAPEALDKALAHAGPSSVLCAPAGAYTGNFELKHAGIRLIALEPGKVMLEGNLLVAQPAVIIGFHIKGSVVLGRDAGGSALAANEIVEPAVSDTADVLLIGNRVHAKDAVFTPAGPILAALHVPPRAYGLRVMVDTAALHAASGSHMAGWVRTRDVVRASARPEAGDARFGLFEEVGFFHGGRPFQWLGADGLAPLGPAIAEVEDESMSWKAVFGPGKVADVMPGIVLPLHVAPWNLARDGMIFLLEPPH